MEVIMLIKGIQVDEERRSAAKQARKTTRQQGNEA
jgi:hypothetical protein